MSHIDKALRVWEGTAVADDAEGDSKPQSAYRLAQYPRERGAIDARPDVTATTDAEVAPLPAFAPRPQLARLPRNGDLHARLVSGDADPVSQEQYRRLAAALHDAQVARGLKTVMVTSALPGEGKTLTVVNLAMTLCESYARRVLVIDADLRWPSLHAMLGVPNVAGLSEALAAERCDLPVTEVSPRLSVMTAGQPGPAPLACLTSGRMGALLEECGSRFDWVLLDTSPVGLLPDGQVVSRLIGAVILVIHAGVTPAAAVERAVADLGPDCILGTVLNRVEKHRIPDADYYAHYRAPASSDSE